MHKKIKELIKQVHPKGVPENVSIVAMGGSSAFYLKVAMSSGSKNRVADEVWAINAVGGVIFHNLVFQMDDLMVQEARSEQFPDSTVTHTLTWLRKHSRFFTSTVYEGYPGAIEYPLEEVCNELGINYFNNTVPYAVAWAIVIGVKSLTLYGCDYSYPDQHKAEAGRGNVEFLLGIAHQRGIKVLLPEQATLMDKCIPERWKYYGYDAWDIETEYKNGRYKLKKTRRSELPTVDEIEARYNPDIHIRSKK